MAFESVSTIPAPYNPVTRIWSRPTCTPWLDKERSVGRLLGPFAPNDLGILPALHVNRFGVIPKGHNTGKWRLITDLSHPPGDSVNSGIDPELCSLSYISVDQI
jgi:hypothetical protein